MRNRVYLAGGLAAAIGVVFHTATMQLPDGQWLAAWAVFIGVGLVFLLFAKNYAAKRCPTPVTVTFDPALNWKISAVAITLWVVFHFSSAVFGARASLPVVIVGVPLVLVIFLTGLIRK